MSISQNPSIEAALKKFNESPVPKVHKVALAFSGGLDSSLAIELLKRVYKVSEIVAITVDIGQGEDEIAKGCKIAKELGVDPIVISAQEAFTTVWLKKAIFANSNYDGYPVSTSMTRQLIAKIVALKAMEMGCDALMEGSSGKGNDQFRMHNVFKFFAPDLDILVPVRDFDLTRHEEMVLCEHWGVPVEEAIVGGDDKTLWARSIASGAIGLDQKIPDSAWLWRTPPLLAPEDPLEIELTFEKGLPVALDGISLGLGSLIDKLNVLGGSHGLGLVDIGENGIMGLKSREIYEAPGAEIILKMHKDLEQFCLTKEELKFKAMADAKWGELVYLGMWFHPLKKALDSFIETTQRVVNGAYTLRLYKGSMEITSRALPTSLFSSEIRSITSSSFDQKWCKDTAKIKGLIFELLAMRGLNDE